MSNVARLHHHLIDAFNRRDWQAALRAAEPLLAQVPDHPGANYMSGVAWLESGHLVKALTHLHVSTRLASNRPDVWATYAHALAEGKLSGESVAAVDQALALEPQDPHVLDTLAMVLTRAEAHERAQSVYQKAVSAGPGHADIRHNYALSLMFTGDLDGAYTQVAQCLRCDPGYWKAYGTRSHLKRANAQDNHVQQLEALRKEHARDPEAMEALGMALAREYDDLGRHLDSFTALTDAKARARARQHYSFEHDRDMFEALFEMPPEVAQSTSGCLETAPIFIMGMPRSGTTLVDRIVSSHPDVKSAGELHQLGSLLKRLSASPTAAALDRATISRVRSLDWARLGREYLQSVRSIMGKPKRFIDKQPHNFLYAGYIMNAFPRVPVICLRRHPMDVCLSNFRQVFGERSAFHGYALDLLDTGRYYLLFDRLMRQWKAAYPGRILEVSYEDLVQDQERVTREILEFCGLDWHPDCLAFERNPSSVSTASAVQVRSPMNTRSLGRWKRYASSLTELRALLEAGGLSIRD